MKGRCWIGVLAVFLLCAASGLCSALAVSDTLPEMEEKSVERRSLCVSAWQGNSPDHFGLDRNYDILSAARKDEILAFLRSSGSAEKEHEKAGHLRVQVAPEQDQQTPVPDKTETPKLSNQPEPHETYLQFARSVRPCVVRVNSKSKGIRDSGVIVRADGLILTTTNVAKDADEIEVTLSDNRSFTAKLIGSDPEGGLAIIKIDAEKLPVLTLGDSDHLLAGDPAFTPSFNGNTVTGKIKATDVTAVGLLGYENFILMDTPISPGDGGSPLLEGNGKVVGINIGIISKPMTEEKLKKLLRSAESAKGGLVGGGTVAIPSNAAKLILNELAAYGRVRRGVLGANMQDLNESLAKSFGRSDTEGALITQVLPGSPAEKAGIKPGDIVITFKGRPVSGASQLKNMIGNEKPGSPAELAIFRDKKPLSIVATLGERVHAKKSVVSQPSAPASMREFGTELEKVSAQSGKTQGLQEGVGLLVKKVDGLAAKMGVKDGDVLVEIDGKTLSEVSDFAKAFTEAKNNNVIRIKIQRAGEKVFLTSPVIFMPQKPKASTSMDSEDATVELLGIQIESISETTPLGSGVKERKNIQIKAVTDSDGLGKKMGLRTGDMVLEADGKPIPDIAAFIAAVNDAKQIGLIRLKIQRNSVNLFLAGPLN